LQPTARHISGFKVWNKMYIFIQNRNNWWRWGVKLKPWLFYGQQFPILFCHFSPTVMNENIPNVMFGWRTLLSANMLWQLTSLFTLLCFLPYTTF
jgi:hypothetical protein